MIWFVFIHIQGKQKHSMSILSRNLMISGHQYYFYTFNLYFVVFFLPGQVQKINRAGINQADVQPVGKSLNHTGEDLYLKHIVKIMSFVTA